MSERDEVATAAMIVELREHMIARLEEIAARIEQIDARTGQMARMQLMSAARGPAPLPEGPDAAR